MTDPARRPLRVLEVATRYFPDMGGTEAHVHEVTTRMGRRGDLDLTVFASDRSRTLARTEAADGFTVVRRPAYPRSKDYYFSPGLPQVIRGGHWDLIHFQGVHTFVPILGMMTARACGIPYVLTFHTGGHSSALRSSSREVQWRLLRPLLRNARRLIAVGPSERAAFQARTGLPDDRFVVIRNGGSLPRPAVDVQAVSGRIVSSGRLERYKGHDRVIAALPTIRKTHPDAHLVILGSGPYEAALYDAARRLGLQDVVTIRQIPAGDRELMARELGQASVMAALSDYEAHPVAIMEAVALGLPVVGTNIAGTGDLVAEGLVRGVAPGSDATTTALAISAALTEGRTHAADVRPLPTWDECVGALAEVYLACADPR